MFAVSAGPLAGQGSVAEGKPKPVLAVAFVLGWVEPEPGVSVEALAIEPERAMEVGPGVWTGQLINFRAWIELVVGRG